MTPGQGLGWLQEIFVSVRCASCGASYAREDVSVVGQREDYWFVRCACGTCGTQGVGVVIVKEIVAPPRARPIRLDEVLEVHDLLRGYSGDIHGLFEPTP